MSSFLTAQTVYDFTGLLMRHFETFSSGLHLKVFKEPLKTVSDTNADYYPGYGNTASPANYTLTPVSGIYPCMRVYDKTKEQQLTELHTNTLGGYCRIKVKEDARNFIKDGRNESFELEGITFNEAIEETPQYYLGLRFYYFTLKKTL